MKFNKLLSAISIGLLLGTTMVGCQNNNAPYSEKKIISVGKDKIYLDEMMYHVLIAEFQGKVIGAYLGNEKAYWESEYEKGISMRENKQNQILEDVIKYQIYYEEAKKENLTLDQSDQEQVLRTIESMKKNMGEEAISKSQLTDEQLKDITEKIILATKYYNQQLEKTQVDEQAIRNSLSKDEYANYKIQYLFIPTKCKDEKGEIRALNSEEAKVAYNKIMQYRNQFIEVKKLDKLVIESEDEQIIKTGEISFTETNHPFENETEIIEICKRINDGDISEVFSTSQGYYVIRKLENPINTYEQAVREAVQQACENQIKADYEKLKKQYEVSINKREWKKIHIGTMTI